MNIRIGTDCSGIEAPIEALKKICNDYKDLRFQHIFSSETNQYAIKYINENHKPEILFGDIQKRNVNGVKELKNSLIQEISNLKKFFILKENQLINF